MTRTIEGEISPTICFVFSTPLGWACMAWENELLKSLRFGLATASMIAPPDWGIQASEGSLQPFQRDAVNRVIRFLNGTRVDFRDLLTVPTSETAFGRRVVEVCRAIPWGQTRTYAEVAEKAGSPGGARAVGNVMRSNPLPLIIPCHRVVGSGGSLGGYSAPGGVVTKEWLIAMEQNDAENMREIEEKRDWLFANSPANKRGLVHVH